MQKNRAYYSTAKIDRSKKDKTLTANKLRKYKGLENLTEAQADQAIDAIEKLSILFFYMLKNHEFISYEDESIN